MIETLRNQTPVGASPASTAAEDGNIARWLFRTAISNPGSPGLYSGKTLVASYEEWAKHAQALSVWFIEKYGISKGDRVAIFLKNDPAYFELLYAIWWIGAVAVPVNAKLHPAELCWIVDNAGASLLVTEDGKALKGQAIRSCLEISLFDVRSIARDKPAELRPPMVVDPDAVAWLFYTSGTTGRPKGAMLTHRNLMMMSMAFALDVDQVSADDTALYAAPLSHGAGLYHLAYLRAGAAHVVPDSRNFDSEEIISLTRFHDRIGFFAAPTMVQRFVEASVNCGYRGQGIKTIIYGGGPMLLAQLNAAIDQLGNRFVQIYGQGECPMTITSLSRSVISDRSHPRADQRRASVGQAQVGVTVAVLNEDRAALAPGLIGEVAVKGPVVMQGYWNNADATSEALKDGWLLTGDLGKFDEDGFLTLVDRSRDVVISGGTNIYPREVEEVLITHPSIREVSVFGVPDLAWGESAVAAICLEQGAKVDNEVLGAWCKAHLASFKKPKAFVMLNELPKNAYGKILKRDLIEAYRGLFDMDSDKT